MTNAKGRQLKKLTRPKACLEILNLLQLANKFNLFKSGSVWKFVKGKGLPQHAEVAKGVPGRLRPRIVLTFGTTWVVGRKPYAPAVFTLGGIPGTHF